MRYSSPEDQARAYEDHAPPVQKKKSKLLLWIVGALVLAGLVLCSVGILTSFGTDASNGVEPISISTSTVPAPPAVKGKSIPDAGSRPTLDKPKPKPVTIPDGTWIVGEEVPAGKYRSPGAQDSFMTFCNWSVTADAGDGDFLDGGSVGEVAEPARVTLKKGQAFKTSGCQDWVKQ